MHKVSDKEIITKLQYGTSTEVNKILSYLHRQVFKQVSNFIKKYFGTSDDTEDVFQDGLLAMYKLARRGALNENTNAEAYLFTICKNLWFQQLRKRKEIVSMEEMPKDIEVQSVSLFNMMKHEEQKEIRKFLELLGEGCRNVLIDYYYKKIRMREIAERMGYSSEQVAKNRKSDCMKKLKKLMQASSFFKNRLT